MGDAAPGESPVQPRADAVFERQLATARVASSSNAGTTSAGPRGVKRTIAAAATQLSGGEAAAALANAYTSMFHEPPSPATLRVLVAQWAHETGGGRAMMNYNFGGIKGSSSSGLSAAYRTTEGEGTSALKIVDRFRAYESAAEGATDYVRFLSTRYAGAMTEARQGNAEGFVRALKRGGYFTGSEEDYVRSLTRLTEQAKVAGFDALGHGSAVEAVASRSAAHVNGAPAIRGAGAIAASALPPRADASNAEAAMQAYRAADALAMADELCRAAIRIAAGDDERRRG